MVAHARKQGATCTEKQKQKKTSNQIIKEATKLICSTCTLLMLVRILANIKYLSLRIQIKSYAKKAFK
jgi:hypothetical protein